MRTTLVLALGSLVALAGCAEREVILSGERLAVRGEAGAVAAGAANRALPIALPAMQANADWPQRAGNVRHASPHGRLSALPQLAFSVPIGQGNTRRNRISAAPVVADGRVFTLDAVARLAATSTGGQPLWSVDLTPPADSANPVSGGGLAYGAGRIVVATGFGELVAVDPATGRIAWRQRLDAPVTGAPAVDGDTVYVVGRDGSAWAVDAGNGRVRWTLPGTPQDSGMIGSSAPAVTDRAVLLPFGDGTVTAALKGSGIRVWNTIVGGERPGRAFAQIDDITGDPVVQGATTFVGTTAGRTLAFDTASGEEIWAAPEGALGPVLAVGGSVFTVNDEARLVRLDAATGERIWSVPLPYFTTDRVRRRDAIVAHYGPVLAGGRIAVAGGDGVLRLFDPVSGALVATAAIPGGAASQPALAGGLLYVVGADGQLHAFR